MTQTEISGNRDHGSALGLVIDYQWKYRKCVNGVGTSLISLLWIKISLHTSYVFLASTFGYEWMYLNTRVAMPQKVLGNICYLNTHW